jgi:hypothetical protein
MVILREECREAMNANIEKVIVDLLPAGEGSVSAETLRQALTDISQLAYLKGESASYSKLITTRDLAEMFGVDKTRANALARNRHKRYGIGYQIPGTNQWLFRQEDLNLLLPDKPGRPAKS